MASASSLDRCTAGWNAKSKFASVWPVGRPESRSDVRTRRSSRRSSSPRSSCSSNAGVPRSSLTARVRIAGRASAANSSPSFTSWSTNVPRSADRRLGGQRRRPLRLVRVRRLLWSSSGHLRQRGVEVHRPSLHRQRRRSPGASGPSAPAAWAGAPRAVPGPS